MSALQWILAVYIGAGVTYWLAVLEAEDNPVEDA